MCYMVFPSHCFILSKDMLGFVFWPSQTHLVTSSVPNLHIRRNLNISGRKKDIANRKTSSFWALKGLFNKLLFNSFIFYFIGTLTFVSLNRDAFITLILFAPKTKQIRNIFTFSLCQNLQVEQFFVTHIQMQTLMIMMSSSYPCKQWRSKRLMLSLRYYMHKKCKTDLWN